MKAHKKLAHTISVIVIAVGVVMSALFLSSCGKETANDSFEKTSLVVAVQKTQNAPGYCSTAQEEIEKAQKRHSVFQAVVIDGEPFTVFPEAATLGKQEGNPDNIASANAAQAANINTAISLTKGKTPEVDLAEALALADRIHSAANAKGVTVVYATGLSTAGGVDLTGAGMLGIESDVLTAHLQTLGYDLSHTERILWYGFGDVDGEQEDLTPALEQSLKATYEETFVALGVEAVEFRDDLPDTDDSLTSDQPSMSTIDVPELKEIEVSVGSETKLRPETLPFIAGTAELVDENSAVSAVQPFAKAMLEDERLVVTVAGSTAGYPWDREYAYRLGEERAQSVAKLLVSLGVDESRIEVTSYGDEAADHVNDIDSSTGMQIPELAQQNRWVSIALNSK